MAKPRFALHRDFIYDPAAGANKTHASSEARKQFFFEKKNQKTFVPVPFSPSRKCRFPGKREDLKVFCFFFSKKKCLPTLAWLSPDCPEVGRHRGCQKGKHFFFEKKKQKTFMFWLLPIIQ
jgi:hypothetical protein